MSIQLDRDATVRKVGEAELRVSDLVVFRGPGGVRVEFSRVREARTISGADRQPAAIEGASNECIDGPVGAEGILDHQYPAFGCGGLVRMEARGLLSTFGGELCFARVLRRGGRGERDDDHGSSGGGQPARLEPWQRPLGMRDPQSDGQPGQRQHDVDACELRHAQVQDAGAGVYRGGGQDIPPADEERVDRLLGLVLLIPRGRQPEELTSGVHDRVVRRVLCRLDPPDEDKPGAGRDDRVAAERDERQRKQHTREPSVPDEARRDKCLEQERRHVDPQLIFARIRADESLPVERGVDERQVVDVIGQQARDRVLARGVHDVEQHDQRRDHPQMPAAQNEPEASGRGHRRLRLGGLA